LLQSRIDQTYLDKLDKKISEDFWKSNSKKWTDEKEELTMKLLAHQKADSNYIEKASSVLELAGKASELFKKQNSEQKRRLITMIVSNCSYKDENLDIQLKPVFNMIFKSKKTSKWCA